MTHDVVLRRSIAGSVHLTLPTATTNICTCPDLRCRLAGCVSSPASDTGGTGRDPQPWCGQLARWQRPVVGDGGDCGAQQHV